MAAERLQPRWTVTSNTLTMKTNIERDGARRRDEARGGRVRETPPSSSLLSNPTLLLFRSGGSVEWSPTGSGRRDTEAHFKADNAALCCAVSNAALISLYAFEEGATLPSTLLLQRVSEGTLLEPRTH